MEYNGYMIINDGIYGHKMIKPLSRGSVPLSLRGMYTDSRQAQIAIDKETVNKKE